MSSYTIFSCPSCKQKMSVDTSWCGKTVECPFCYSRVVFSLKHETHKSSDKKLNRLIWLWGGIFLVVFVCFIITGITITLFVSSIEPDEEKDNSGTVALSHIYEKELSDDACRAKMYIDSLPEGQRDVFYGRGGSSSDRMNLYQNLLDSGNISGALEILENE